MASKNKSDVVTLIGGLIVITISLTIGYFLLNTERQIEYVDENGRPLSQKEIAGFLKSSKAQTTSLDSATSIKSEQSVFSMSGATSDTGSYYPVLDINHFCKRKWKSDYRMINYCTEQQTNARKKAQRMNIDHDISKLCAKKWNDDWNMFHYCSDQQMQAKYPSSNLPTEPVVNIERFCDDKWPDNFSMQVHCVEQQDNARSEVRTKFVSERVARHCARKWPSNWSMYAHCVKQQNDARRKLGL